MKPKSPVCVLALLGVCLATGPAGAQEPFANLVRPAQVGPVKWKPGQALEVPYITWGGDVATFHANGGLATKPGTLYHKLGLNLKLVAGDDFVGQVKRYLAGQTPFLRGTMRMLGLASEVVGSDPRTKAVIFLQMTWSAGDHLVSRAHLKTLSDLKGKKVALQKGGPHVGMLDDVLRTAKLTWKDLTVVWTEDLTGDKGAAALFRKDAALDACMVISPDMIGLTGGLDQTGTGAEGTVKGARVLVSTATMSRSIADVYACRKDFYDAHKDVVEKFTAGYLKACEEVLEHKAEYEKKGSSAPYKAMLQLTQDIYGKEVIPTLEVDAHGLISDCRYVGLPGNLVFFTHKGNPDGFEAKQRAALDLVVSQGWAKVRAGFLPPDFNYDKLTKLGGLTKTAATVKPGPETVDPNLFKDPGGERTIYFFTISFEPNQETFDPDVYGPEFQRVVELASRFGNAVIAVRGHTDPTKTLYDLVVAGMEKGLLKRTGKPGQYEYYLDGKKLEWTDTKRIEELIAQGAFDGAKTANPRETMQAALNLSQVRAEAVRSAVVQFAKDKGFLLNTTQLQPVGVGIREPLVYKPKNPEEAKTNMRVEFRILRVTAEASRSADFDF
jgi:outer membrane protein OmpA-like peptidoglycan-associated protein